MKKQITLFLSLAVFLILVQPTFSAILNLPSPGGGKLPPPGGETGDIFTIALSFKETGEIPSLIGIPTVSIGSDDAGKGQVTLSWEVTYETIGSTGNVTNKEAICTASGDWSGEKPMRGEEKITFPSHSTSYTLTCAKKDKPEETISRTAQIIVKNIHLSVNPQIIILGERITLTYDISSIWGLSFSLSTTTTIKPKPTTTVIIPKFLPGALFDIPNSLDGKDSGLIDKTNLADITTGKIQPLDCYLNDKKLENLSSTGKTGKISQAPADDTTYTLKCTWKDNLGTHQSSTSASLVKVAKVDFDIYPKKYYKELVQIPLDVLLAWESKYFNKCEASSNPNVWSGEKSLSGQEIADINGSTTFTLTCSGIDGDFSRKKTISQKVEEKSLFKEGVWIIANPSEVEPNEEVIISWGLGGFDDCSFSSKPKVYVLAYSNDTSATKKCMWGRNTVDVKCWKNLSHKWVEQKDRTFSSFVSASGYGSVKVKLVEDTEFRIECESYPDIEIIEGGEKTESEFVGEYQVMSYSLTPDGQLEIVLRDPKTGKEQTQTFQTDAKGYTSSGKVGSGGSTNLSSTLADNFGITTVSNKDMSINFKEDAPVYNYGQIEHTKTIGGADLFKNSTVKLPDRVVAVGGGSDSASIIVKVISPTALQVSLEANPTQIPKGEKTTLTYSSLNGSTTTDCIATSTDNVWEKEVTPDNEGNTSGSDEVILNEEKTYDFFYTCYDKDNKSKTATAQVVVGECPEGEESPHKECQDGECVSVDSCGEDTCKEDEDCETLPVCSVTLEAVPKTIFLGRTLNLEWSPVNTTECRADTFLLKDGQRITSEEIKSQGGGWYGLLLSPANEQLYKNTDIDFDPKPSLNSPHTSTLKPTARGNYVYTISCDCTAEEEAEVETEITTEEEVEVKVIPVPYWREIIPVLPGFLRGLFNR